MATVLQQQPTRVQSTRSRGALTYCDGCGGLSYDKEKICPRCGHQSLEPVSPMGEIYSYTTVHEEDRSFVLALVQILDGPLVTAQIVNLDGGLRIGLPVQFAPDTQSSSDSAPHGLFFSPRDQLNITSSTFPLDQITKGYDQACK